MNIFDLKPIHISKIIASEKRMYREGFSNTVSTYRDYQDNFPHGFYTFFYCISGEIEYIFQHKTFHIFPNQFVFLDKYHPFTFRSVNSDFEVYLINFVAECGFVDEPVLFSPVNNNIYLSIFRESASAFKSRQPGFEFMTISLLMKLLATIKNDLAASVNSNTKNDKVIFAIDYMKANIDNECFSIEHLASEMNVSTSYLRNIFVDFCGIPPIKYFKKMRILQAADILTAENCSVSETAVRCGYSDVSYFCRDFKKILGTSPHRFKTKNN